MSETIVIKMHGETVKFTVCMMPSDWESLDLTGPPG